MHTRLFVDDEKSSKNNDCPEAADKIVYEKVCKSQMVN